MLKLAVGVVPDSDVLVAAYNCLSRVSEDEVPSEILHALHHLVEHIVKYEEVALFIEGG